RVEGAEEAVAGGTDEHQLAGGDDRTAEGVVAAGVLLALGQLLSDPEACGPCDIAGIGIDRDELSPGWTNARKVHPPPVFRGEARAERRIGSGPLQAAAVVDLVGIGGAASIVAVFLAPFDPADAAALAHVDENDPPVRVD